MIPKSQQRFDSDFSEDEESLNEPLAPQIGGSLKNMENFLIKGDLRRCVICNQKYACPDEKSGV